MEIKKIGGNARCDMPLCRAKAEYQLTKQGLPLAKGVNLCGECLVNLAELLKTEEKDVDEKKGKRN